MEIGLEANALMSWQLIQDASAFSVIFIMTFVQIGTAIWQRRALVGSGRLEFDIDAILDDERARSALLKHCTNELSSENVLFLIEVRMWVADWPEEESGRMADRAKAIFETYVSEWSEMTINVSYAIRSELTKAIEVMAYDKKPSQDLFAKAVGECEQNILQDSLPRFQETKIFKEEITKTGVFDKITKKAAQPKDLIKVIYHESGDGAGAGSPSKKAAGKVASRTDSDSQLSGELTPRQSFDALGN
jgi:hypothetical protein